MRRVRACDQSVTDRHGSDNFCLSSIQEGPRRVFTFSSRMGRNNKRGRGKTRDDVYRSDLIDKTTMNNHRFETYYQTQNIIPGDEWDAFMASLRLPLPTTNAQSLNKILSDIHVPSLSGVVFEDQHVVPPVQIPWYPDGLAWQFNVSKKVLRKSPEFKGFHSFLVFETEVGNISRQEAVSMLPPLFLEVQPHHKTAQLLEALHAQDTMTSSSIPTGLVLANDSDHKRTHLLIHQSSRLPSPALMVTNLDASIFPSIKVPSATQKEKMETLSFDRILCDVPCSGDGTLRKNLGIWKTWQPMDGNGLHGLQLRIILRAMKMLAPNGRIVYSTCSLNPVENEAVIAYFELVDVSAKLPELQRRPGMTSWRPTDKSLNTTYETYETYQNTCKDPDAVKSKFTRGHWPPPDVDSLNLHRCIRVYPHLQDTGGFFVAVLERRARAAMEEPTKQVKREASEPVETPEIKRPRLDDAKVEDYAEDVTAEDSIKIETEEQVKSAPVELKKKDKGDGGAGTFKENPYTFLEPDDPTVVSCIDRLHLTPSFPANNVLVRNPEGEAARALYITNSLVKTIIQLNDYKRMRLTFAGTKVFTKQEAGRGAEAQFRILGEGLPLVLPFLDPATVLEGDTEVLRILVEGHYPLVDVFPDPFRSQMRETEMGSQIIRFPRDNLNGVSFAHDLVLPTWKSNVSLTLMIDKKAKSALSMRVFGLDISTPPKERAAVDTAVNSEDPAVLSGAVVVDAVQDSSMMDS
ncbi:unnamed protein product [Mycena citricolor]|uniref:SAM-dependent MTase RsmB/NOP-type domain-containing protein n=1 Tax=Mycena citricolor TaxID=2018698 RepID=A0AAD2HDV5_9AGAR|nr:unnamed protein product [Mycena citricolor]